MVVNDQFKYIFVSVAKCASTSIRRRLGYFKDPLPHIYHMFLRDILASKPHAKDYFKFGFVRNPYDRFYSSYINFKYDGHPSWADPFRAYPKFEQFALDFENSKCSKVIHMQPQTDYLFVDGELGVDFLGRFENLTADFHAIERALGMPHKDLIRTRIASTQRHDPKVYTDDMKKVVQRFYKQDFENFGYEY